MSLVRVAFLFALTLSAADDGSAVLQKANGDLDAGRYSEAIRRAKVAEAIYQQSGNEDGRAFALTTEGEAQMYSGDYAPAVQNLETALQIAQKLKDVSSQIARLNDIGNAYYFQGSYGEAMARYQQAMGTVEAAPNEKWSAWGKRVTTANIAVLYQSVGQFDRALTLFTSLLKSTPALPPAEEAQLLSNVGVLRRRLGDPQKALDTYRAAQALYQKEAQHAGEIAVLHNIGIVQAMDFHDYPQAGKTFAAALQLAEKSGDLPLAVQGHLFKGEALYLNARAADAEEDFTQAVALARKLGQKEDEWRSLYGLARLAQMNGQLEESRKLLKQAVAVIESLREGTGNSNLRTAFLADKREVYDLLIENSHHPDEAFQLMEASRARMLRDKLPHSANTSLGALQSSLPADLGVLEYWQGNSAAAVVWVSKASRGMRSWKVSPADRERMAELPSVLSDPKRLDWKALADQAASELLRDIPVLNDPAITRLQIVPDGMLASIPFEALPYSTTALMVERFAISYLPSIRLAQKADHRLFWPWESGFAGFADPQIGSGNDGAFAGSRAWVNLPQAAKEVRELAAILPGRSLIFSGPAAQKRRLQQVLNVPILHFATHAFAERENPDLSFILFAPASAGQQFDYLFLREVYSLQLSGVDLVTLSACETNTGKLAPGEGVLGFGNAFLAAGARSVVSSLWSVGDKPTEELMKRFYRNSMDGGTLAEGLRSAKLEILRSRSAAHPALWAGFVLTASADHRMMQTVGWKAITTAGLSALAFGALIFRVRKSAKRA